MGGEPYESFSEIDPETGKRAQKIRFREVPPARLRKLAAHIVGDLRHALDQAAYAACAELLSNPPATLYFPFASHPNDLSVRLVKGAYPDELHDVFQRLEPYPTGDGYTGGSDEFFALSKMANSNKHVVAIDARPMAMLNEVSGRSVAGLSIPESPQWDRAKHEMTVAFTAPDSQGDIKINLAGFITFSDVRALEGEPVQNVLGFFLQRVEQSISALESEIGVLRAVRAYEAAHGLDPA